MSLYTTFVSSVLLLFVPRPFYKHTSFVLLGTSILCLCLRKIMARCTSVPDFNEMGTCSSNLRLLSVSYFSDKLFDDDSIINLQCDKTTAFNVETLLNKNWDLLDPLVKEQYSNIIHTLRLVDNLERMGGVFIHNSRRGFVRIKNLTDLDCDVICSIKIDSHEISKLLMQKQK